MKSFLYLVVFSFFVLKLIDPGVCSFFTIVVLPDTQYYSSYWDEFFQEQTFWACQCSSQDRLNILFVSHLGDLVHRENEYQSDWRNARLAMDNLGRCGLPHATLPGNHDVTYGSQTPYLYYEQMFPLEIEKEWFGGEFEKGNSRNTYQFFQHDNEEYLFLHLEYLPMSENGTQILLWASRILDDHVNRTAFLSTHYVGDDCSGESYAPVSKLMEKHCNLKISFGGHVFQCGGEANITVVNQCNQTSYIFVTNYQNRDKGGTGWLRYYTFFRDDPELMCAFTYSPFLERFETDENSFFSVDIQNDTISPGCAQKELKQCFSHYASPGFVLALVIINSTNIIFLFYFVFVLSMT